MSASSASLRLLAKRTGIELGYTDLLGKRHVTSDETIVALAAAMGVDASSSKALRNSHETLDRQLRDAACPGVCVRNIGSGPSTGSYVRVLLPEAWRRREGGGLGAGVGWESELEDEHGIRRSIGHAARSKDGSVRVDLQVPNVLGYHRLHLRLFSAGMSLDAEQLLVVTPRKLPAPRIAMGAPSAFGLTASLYSVRSARNWGVGDTGDLRDLVNWAASSGAGFVGVNPLHALFNQGHDISPYRPASRLFRNVIYLDVEAIPELNGCPKARDLLSSARFRRDLARLRDSTHVEYEKVFVLKMHVLRLLYETFESRLGSDATHATRRKKYERYLAEQGEPLNDYATFMALRDHFGRQARPKRRGADDSWHTWPEAYRDKNSGDVRSFRIRHAEETGFHAYMQFELDRQLAETSAMASSMGLAAGIYQDLALGSSPDGSDPWSFPGLFTKGASIGAPPDEIAPQGQNWAVPPINPNVLRQDQYRFWILLLRASLRHSRALRIDHVMGLFRQFWIPDGGTGSDGAYVRYPANDLLGILVLEASRAGALVVGEDLGTVPKEVPRAMKRRGVLASRVLYFQRDRKGRFVASRAYSTESLTTANTHDLPTLAGFWRGRDIQIRRQLGLLKSRGGVAKALAERNRAKRELLRLLIREKVLQRPTVKLTVAELIDAVHAFLLKTPAVLVGLSLDDMLRETEPVNVPGVSPKEYPSWTRKLRLPLSALTTTAHQHRLRTAQ
ncbi:MAG: 4-alpha-glucanotransferase [Gemmatimonadaceae bacterium]